MHALDHTLAFGVKELQRIKNSVDLEKAFEWVGVLRKMEGKREHWRD